MKIFFFLGGEGGRGGVLQHEFFLGGDYNMKIFI